MESGRKEITVSQFCALIGISIEDFRSCCLMMGVMHNWSVIDLVTERQIGAVWECYEKGKVKINFAAFRKEGFVLSAVKGGHSKIINDIKEKGLKKEANNQPSSDKIFPSDPSIQSPGKSGPEISVPMGGQPGFKKRSRRK